MWKVTTERKVIKEWMCVHKGQPQIIDDPDSKRDTVWVRVDFPGSYDDSYISKKRVTKQASWREFFSVFEAEGLAFEYDESDKLFDPSSSYRLVRKE